MIDGGVHAVVEGRAGALEDPGQPDRDRLARPHRSIVGHPVEGEAEPLTRARAAGRLPMRLAAHRHPSLAARERVASEPERLRREHQALHDETGFDAVHVDHLPALEVGDVVRMGILREEALLHERLQRIGPEPHVLEVVAVRPVEVQEHRRDALARHVGDRHEEGRALVVDDPLVELEQVRSPPRELEPVILQRDRLPVEVVLLLEALVLDVLRRLDVPLREHEDAVVVRPEQLRAVGCERARPRSAREGLELVGTGRRPLGLS